MEDVNILSRWAKLKLLSLFCPLVLEVDEFYITQTSNQQFEEGSISMQFLNCCHCVSVLFWSELGTLSGIYWWIFQLVWY